MVFIDTNVFVYAHDATDPEKTLRARKLLTELTATKSGCISTQVLHEFCNVALKLSAVPLKAADVREIVRELLIPLLAHRPDGPFYIRVLETFEKYSLSFYDAMVVQAAIDLQCTRLYSEDMQAGAKYGKVTVINPFA